MDSTEGLLKQVALGCSGGERWNELVNLYEARAQATLGFLQGISGEAVLRPGLAGRTLIEVVDHIRAWDEWETNAGLVSVAQGRKPPIMELRNFVNREGKVVHYDHLSSHEAVDVFNGDRAEELELFLKYRGLIWSTVIEELEQTTKRLVVALVFKSRPGNLD